LAGLDLHAHVPVDRLAAVLTGREDIVDAGRPAGKTALPSGPLFTAVALSRRIAVTAFWQSGLGWLQARFIRLAAPACGANPPFASALSRGSFNR